MRTAFVTGATGFMGSHFVLNAYGQAYDQFIVMVRGPNEKLRQKKLELALIEASNSYKTPFDVSEIISKCTIINGDLSLPFCGLQTNKIQELKQSNVDFWHFAGALSFNKKQTEHVTETNLKGTTNTLDLNQALSSSHFYYISTVHTCGAKEGLIQEKLHSVDGEFSNAYELSKCKTEHKVIDTCNKQQRNWSILRPSLVIGNSETNKSGGSTTGLYTFIKQISAISRANKHSQEKVRIYGLPNTVPNIIPIDIASKEIIDIINDPKKNQEIFHITSYSSPPIHFITKEIARQLGSESINIQEFDLATASPVERFAARHTKDYSNYFQQIRVYESRRKFKCNIGSYDIANYIAEGIRELKQEQDSQIFETRLIAKEDSDSQLAVFTAGDQNNPPIVIINALGLPTSLLSKLTLALCKSYFILTWNALDSSPEESVAVYSGHAEDLKTIVKSFKLKNVDLIGWCSGAGIALEFAANNPNLTNKLVLLNGAYRHLGAEITDFEVALEDAITKTVNDNDYAETLYNIFYTSKNKIFTQEEIEASDSITAVIDELDHDTYHLVYKPFESPKSIIQYSRLLKGLVDSPSINIKTIQNKTLILSGSDDNSMHSDSGAFINSNLENSTHITLNDANHFMLYNSNECINQVKGFINSNGKYSQ